MNIDVPATLKTILNDRFGIESASIKNDSNLRELGLDSLLLVDVMLDIETAIGVKMNELALPPNPTFNEVVSVINKNISDR